MHMRLSTLLLTLHLAHSWVSVPKFISRAPYTRMAIVGWTRGEDSGDNVDVATVERLIGNRVAARGARNYDELRDIAIRCGRRVASRHRGGIGRSSPTTSIAARSGARHGTSRLAVTTRIMDLTAASGAMPSRATDDVAIGRARTPNS